MILHHLLDGGEHWDLCLEHGDVLLTWQLEREPVECPARPIHARRIADHRKAYLDYEGPISGNRGEVRRVHRGSLELEQRTADGYVFRLASDRLNGRFHLKPAGEDWVFASG